VCYCCCATLHVCGHEERAAGPVPARAGRGCGLARCTRAPFAYWVAVPYGARSAPAEAGRARRQVRPARPLRRWVCVNPTRKGLRMIHTDAFHVSLSLIESLVPIVEQLPLMDAELARALRRSAAAIPQALAAARLASRKGTAQRHR